MMRAPKITATVLVMLAMLPMAARGQEFMQTPSPDGMPPLNAQPPQMQLPAPAASQQQIDQMVAPIALYPDTLVGQILMASTYPLEVVEASRWRQDPNNAQLQGDQLEDALQQLPWDPSVKALIAFPQVLAMMNGNLQWTEQLGDAFLGQQEAVSESIQRLRQMAQAAGNLNSTPQQTVIPEQGVIVIQPAQPEVVYVPVYNPTVVYGAWPWASYPPYYFPPPPGYLFASVGIIGFGIGIGVADWFWGWDRWDWHNHRIDIDDRRFETLNRGRPPVFRGDVWAHDPGHRHGVPYSNPSARAQFQGRADAERRNNFRGFAAPSTTGGRAGGEAIHTHAIENGARPSAFEPSGTTNRRQGVTPQHATVAPAITPRAGGEVLQPQRQQFQHQQQQQPQQQQHQQQFQQQQFQRPQQQHQQFQQTQQRSSPAFESFSRGPEVRAQSQRGSFSRSSVPAAAPQPANAPRAANDGNRSAGGHSGGGHNGGHNGGGRDDKTRNR